MLKDKITSKKVCKGKSDCTTGNEFIVYLSYNGKSVHFDFHDNMYNKSTTDDFTYSLLMDAFSYDFTSGFADFCNEYGYDVEEKQAHKTYLICKGCSKKLHSLFTDDEISELQEEFQDY